jgi:hypothetical protein
MQVLVLGAAIAVATIVGANAADFTYPPPLAPPPPPAALPQPGVVPYPVSPSPVIVPGPAAPPHHNAPVPPPVFGPSPYGVGPQVPPQGAVVPRATCAPVWRCGDRGCNWQPSCAPPPERYYGASEPPGTQVYPSPAPPPARERYLGPNVPQPYSGPAGPYAGARGIYRE